MEVRNAVYNKFGTIDAEINHPELGWIPTTLASNDPDLADEYAAALAMTPTAFSQTLEEAKADRLEELAARRWRAETGGMDFGGTQIDTSTRTQNVFTAAYVKAQGGQGIDNFKYGNGVFAPMSAAQVIAIADAITAHVQACFTNEKNLTDLILAATDTAGVEAVDIETGWP